MAVISQLLKGIRSEVRSIEQSHKFSVATLMANPERLRAFLTTERFRSRLRDLGAREFGDRYGLLGYSVSKAPLDGLILEFGVATGVSINYIAGLVPSRRVVGFDTFEGLPEAWAGYSRRTFSTQGVLPLVRENVSLVKGLFQSTLPDFLKSCDDLIAFVHLDADLYSSTKFVLEALSDRTQSGTVIQFDEFYGYRGWDRDGEYKAYRESLSKRSHSFLGYTSGTPQRSRQVSIRLG